MENKCQYKVWREGELVSCGEEGKCVSYPNNSFMRKFGLKNIVILCHEHHSFVMDAVDRTEIMRNKTTKEKKVKANPFNLLSIE